MPAPTVTRDHRAFAHALHGSADGAFAAKLARAYPLDGRTLNVLPVEPTVASVLQELAYIAFGDATTIFDDAGELLPVSEWPVATRHAIASIEVVLKNAAAGDDVIDRVLKVRFFDKAKTLELLARYLGMLVERKEIGRPGEFSSLSDAELASRIHRASSKLLTITASPVETTPTDTVDANEPDLDAIISPDEPE